MRPENPFISKSERASLNWAEKFAAGLNPGDIIGLKGALGTGKTVLCKGICQRLGFKGEVTSPTYSIVQEYNGDQKIIHLDFYRTIKPDELQEIGLEYYINGNNICLIEWPDKLQGSPVEFNYMISIEEIKAGGRIISFETFSH